jgi:sugar/nucleoside kinase (ribokinase family)
MLDGCGPLECVRLAAATGASCVTAYDALGGLLSFEELRQKMEAGWERQNIIHP